MYNIKKIDTNDKSDISRFIKIPYRLYKDHPQWVPPLLIDSKLQLNRQKHPFYEHSFADFYIISNEDEDVGRIAVLENTRYNQYHNTRTAQFYLFDCVDDQEVANKLFECAFDWSRRRKMEKIIGPKGFAALDGYGMLIEGYEHRQLMTMMNYNYPYYVRMVENIGFEKEVDFLSCYIPSTKFNLPERIHKIADRVQERGTLTVHRFETKQDLKDWAGRIGQTYNNSFVNNWEYAPLTEKEIKFVLDNILIIADPRLIKIITHKDQVVGFLFGFHDLSAALQRAKGRLLPIGIFDILLEKRRTKWVALNGAGILPEFQGHGGNALLYSEMEKTVKDYGFLHADLTQIAETAVQMRRDLINLGGEPYKNHRVFRKTL